MFVAIEDDGRAVGCSNRIYLSCMNAVRKLVTNRIRCYDLNFHENLMQGYVTYAKWISPSRHDHEGFIIVKVAISNSAA